MNQIRFESGFYIGGNSSENQERTDLSGRFK